MWLWLSDFPKWLAMLLVSLKLVLMVLPTPSIIFQAILAPIWEPSMIGITRELNSLDLPRSGGAFIVRMVVADFPFFSFLFSCFTVPLQAQVALRLFTGQEERFSVDRLSSTFLFGTEQLVSNTMLGKIWAPRDGIGRTCTSI